MSFESAPKPETLRQAAEILLSGETDQIGFCPDGGALCLFLRRIEYASQRYEGWPVWPGEEKALLCLFLAEAIEQGDL